MGREKATGPSKTVLTWRCFVYWPQLRWARFRHWRVVWPSKAHKVTGRPLQTARLANWPTFRGFSHLSWLYCRRLTGPTRESRRLLRRLLLLNSSCRAEAEAGRKLELKSSSRTHTHSQSCTVGTKTKSTKRPPVKAKSIWRRPFTSNSSLFLSYFTWADKIFE